MAFKNFEPRDGMPNVAVEVRIKPNSRNILEFSQNRISVGSKTYTFSKVHSSITQQMLFTASVVPYVEHFLQGENCSVLAYGQTGSGKTYTMGITSKSERGIVYNVLEMLFRQNLRFGCSFIEIYNEDIIDLLGDSRVPLNIRQGRNDINIVGLKEVEVGSLSEAMTLLCLGSDKRTTKSTKMNSESSRSHAVFSVTMRQLSAGKIVESKMTFVDLAGSERLKRTECTGSTARESISINTGLLSLGNVISSLYLKKPHVPFRDSKLTRILQKCLTGHVLLIACVSGLQEDMFETTNTLKYASRAALISLDSRVSIETDKEKLVILNLRKEISALKDENNRLRASAIGAGLKSDNIRNHPVVVELIGRLRMYEGEDVLQKILVPQRETETHALHVNEHVQRGFQQIGKCDRFLPFFQKRAAKESWRSDGSTEKPTLEQNYARATDCLDNKIFGSVDISGCSPSSPGIEKAPCLTRITEHENGPIWEAAAHCPHSSIESSIIACEDEKIEAENGQQTGPRRRLVTFDPEPKLKKSLFTPLRECSRVSLRLVDTVRNMAAVSFAVHNNKLMFACVDGKIRSYDTKVSIVLSDDSIRCMCSSTELYYSTRSLLKVYTGSGRPLPVYAYKKEITCMKICDELVYTGHEDGSLCIVDMRSNGMIFSEKVHYEPVSGIQVIGNQIYSSSWDHSVKFAQLEVLGNTGSSKRSFGALMPPHYDAVTGMLSYKGRCISFGRDCSIKSWDSGSPGKTVPYAHESWIRCGCALDGFFATGCKEGVVRCWDILDKTIRCVGRLGFDSGVCCMIGQENSVWIGCQNKNIYRYEFNQTSILK